MLPKRSILIKLQKLIKKTNADALLFLYEVSIHVFLGGIYGLSL